MFKISSECFKCNLNTCVQCTGIQAKKDRILSLMSHKQRTLELGKLGKLDLTKTLSIIKHLDFKISQIRAHG